MFKILRGARTRHHGDNGGGVYSKRIVARWWFASVVCSYLVSGVVHEAVAFVAMRRTFMPFNTFFLAFSASITPLWDVVFPVIAGGDVSYLPPAARSSKPPSAAAAAAAIGSGAREAPVESKSLRLAAAISKPETPTAAPDAAEKVRKEEGDTAKNARVEDNLHSGPGPAVTAGSGPGELSAERKRLPIGSWRGRFAVVWYITASMPMNLFVDYLVWQWWRRTHMLE